MSSVLEIDGITLAYGKIVVVHDLSLRVDEGRIVALLGPNGAGKTTVVRAIGGLLPCRTGQVRLRGTRVDGLPPHRMVRQGLGLVPQGRELFPALSVIDNLRLGAYSARDRRRVQEHLERALSYFPRLRDRAAQRAGNLSGGEQQMLAIARALVSSPSVLVLDEPSAGLAPLIVRQVFHEIARIARHEGMTVLIAEQNANQALRIADHAYILETGRVVAEGSRHALLRDDIVRASYLGDVGEAAASH